MDQNYDNALAGVYDRLGVTGLLPQDVRPEDLVRFALHGDWGRRREDAAWIVARLAELGFVEPSVVWHVLASAMAALPNMPCDVLDMGPECIAAESVTSRCLMALGRAAGCEHVPLVAKLGEHPFISMAMTEWYQCLANLVRRFPTQTGHCLGVILERWRDLIMACGGDESGWCDDACTALESAYEAMRAMLRLRPASRIPRSYEFRPTDVDLSVVRSAREAAGLA